MPSDCGVARQWDSIDIERAREYADLYVWAELNNVGRVCVFLWAAVGVSEGSDDEGGHDACERL